MNAGMDHAVDLEKKHVRSSRYMIVCMHIFSASLPSLIAEQLFPAKTPWSIKVFVYISSIHSRC